MSRSYVENIEPCLLRPMPNDNAVPSSLRLGSNTISVTFDAEVPIRFARNICDPQSSLYSIFSNL